MMVTYALWVIAILALLVGQMAGDLHRSFVEERAAAERAELRAAAISGLGAYRRILAGKANPEYSHPLESFRTDPAACVFDCPDGIRTVCFHMVDAGAGRLVPVLGASDEESRINPILAAPEYVARVPGIDPGLLPRPNDDVEGARPLPPRTLAGLASLDGWKEALTPELERNLTAWGQGKVNVNSASPQVLELLGLSKSAVWFLVQFLSGPDEQRGTADDLFFKGLTEIIPRLQDAGCDLTDLEQWRQVIKKGWITVHSLDYRVYSRAAKGVQGGQYEIQAIVRADSSATILAWWEVQPS